MAKGSLKSFLPLYRPRRLEGDGVGGSRSGKVLSTESEWRKPHLKILQLPTKSCSKLILAEVTEGDHS